ncbi:MAG: hypothetical protein QOE83_664 [Actinomycetota bacterium]|nr:hypothetical protein [Actinomycetota bacterium]
MVVFPFAMSGMKPTIQSMRLRDPVHRVSAAAGLAAGGVLIAHSLTYTVIAPHMAARDHLLAATGHGYLPAANLLALLAVLITVGALFLGRLTRPWSTPGWKHLGARMVVLQVGAFLAMELLERWSSGEPLAGLTYGGLLPIGVGFQLLLAGVGTLLVRFLLRASDRFAAALGRAPRIPSARTSVVGTILASPRAQPALLRSFDRGPPPSR